MCGCAGGRKLPAMDKSTVSIRLDLRLEDDVPTGVASTNGGPGTRFSGWLGLMAAIETLSNQIEENTDVDHH
jgi:hypothetical protein